MELDLTPLDNAVGRLAEALDALARDPDNALVRDGTIQRFEFTYELSHKTLRRYLELTSGSPAEVDEMSFPALIRTASERGLLRSGWDRWREYRQARAITSHTYDERKARQVVAAVPDFLEEARHLLGVLRQRSGPGA